MKTSMRNRHNQGFTLVEILAVTALLVILLGIASVAVGRYMRMLKIVELDNAAREIYLAAENRAVLLDNGGQLEKTVVKPDNQFAAGVETVALDAPGETDLYYIASHDAAIDKLVPAGSIDPTLRERHYYIVYEPVSGCVTDVFYAEQPIDTLVDSGFAAFYIQWTQAGRDERMKLEPMLGHYGGGMAERAPVDLLKKPKVTVMIHNEERLWLEVIFEVDKDADWENDVVQDVKLNYKSSTVNMLNLSDKNKGRLKKEGPIEQGEYKKYRYTWILDELVNEQGEEKYAFCYLAGTVTKLGGDFTVTANVSSKSGKFSAAAPASDTNNTLFAEGSTGDTAYLKYLRHLQNLTESAGITDDSKPKAEQIADIRCKSNDTYEGYEFKPIENQYLRSYDGGGFEIRDLYIVQADGKPAGLFSGSPANATYQQVRLVNAEVHGEAHPVGALVGRAGDGNKFDNCWVYWEAEDGSLRELLGSDEEGSQYQYKIIGSTAGGLVGEFSSGRIENCFAATTVSGDTCAGGLIGRCTGWVTVTNSYADCYLAGNAPAGLVGDAGGSVTLTNCYAAGFIDMEKAQNAAGLCLGAGKTDTHYTYSVMRHYNSKDGSDYYPLTQNYLNNIDSYENTYYLGEMVDADNIKKCHKTYAEMTAKGGTSDFASTMGSAFAWKNNGNSHPYNLRENLNLTVFSTPGLAGLPHYGDWGAEFKEPSLVYYERYAGGLYGFSGGNARYLVRELQDDLNIEWDGYAVALLASDLKGAKSVTIRYTYFDAEGKKRERESTEAVTITTTGKNESQEEVEYCLIPLPDALVTGSDYASGDYYQYLSFEMTWGSGTNGGKASGGYFYNPHFAETVIPYAGTGTIDTIESVKEYIKTQLAREPGAVQVRTPRHLYNLSRFSAYSGAGYRFRQGLDLDYGRYHWADEAITEQGPIGSLNEPFAGRYDGGCHVIQGVGFQLPKDSTRLYAGLFGYSTGILQNIVYRMPEEALSFSTDDGSKNLYVGGLVGGSSGTVENCAVEGAHISGASYGSEIYLGGLVGQNNGLIRNCSADSRLLTAEASTFGKVYVGGFVGENLSNRRIATSYTVGRLSGKAESTSAAQVCGFVGRNQGYIGNSYTATDLSINGAGAAVDGFGRGGEMAGDYYLNLGNFTYREKSYSANYKSEGGARPISYQDLHAESSPIPGMARVEGYHYPTGVKRNGVPVHYGECPVPMELGEMGVYYWEKLEIGEAKTYHVSLLAADSTQKTITKESTLSNAHDDGGVVTDYGYGYYVKAENTVTARRSNMEYWGGNGNQFPSDKEANRALEELMPGFMFHSFRSFDPNAEDGAGLYPVKQSSQNLNATMTLTQKETTLSFWMNPHFADALAVKEIEGNSEGTEMEPRLLAPKAEARAADDWKVDAGLYEKPGTANNPYEVRSVGQLELINWNENSTNTSTVVVSSAGSNSDAHHISNFPYLSSADNRERHYWVQSHDLMGGEGKVYTPIAEYYDDVNTTNQKGNLYGWFGSSYDGMDYVIENVNIKGQLSSCVGLFGVVYNGSLENVILYSSDGESYVEGGAKNTDSQWLAVGALAGLAASKDDNAVENCSVAGYAVKVKCYTKALDSAWGGIGAGGLLGLSNMNLKNCTAVANVEIQAEGEVITVNDNIRVGGLVGSCQKSITNCYAGGEVIVSEKMSKVMASEKYVYVGGLVGGSYMKPLDVSDGNTVGVVGKGAGTSANNETNNTLINCYSYVVLPQWMEKPKGTEKRDWNRVNALYVLGGVGELNDAKKFSGDNVANHGVCTITNCYYLEETVLKHNEQKEFLGKKDNRWTDKDFKTDIRVVGGVALPTSLTYQQLAGQEEIDVNGQTIYDKLAGFSPVTTKEGDFSVAGKYSFPPSDIGALKGMDYPFPTILTRDNGAHHVHYGAWPVKGIWRKDGAAPLFLDILAQGGYAEQLNLENVPAGGSWRAESGDGKVAICGMTGDSLWVQAQGIGTTQLTVTYTAGGETYTLALTVNVTANVMLRPEAVRLFPQDTVTLAIKPYGKVQGGGEIPLAQYLREMKASSDSAALTAGVEQGEIIGGQEYPDPLMTLTSSGEFLQDAVVNMSGSYGAYAAAGAVIVSYQALPPVVKAAEEGTYTVSFDGSVVLQEATVLEGKATAEVKDNVLTLKGLAGAAKLEVELTMDGTEHTVTMPVEPPEEPEVTP